MGVEFNEISSKANGGTELMARRLQASLTPELDEAFQIIPSRVRTLDPDKLRVLWCHDLPGDPESDHLKNDGWRKFHMIVFVSHMQRQSYLEYYGIPYDRTTVMQNAIEPFADKDIKKTNTKIKLIYHTTPHRGLELLVPVYKKLCEEFDNLHLDVFSSFEIYGWKERDTPFNELFDMIKEDKTMTYHGYKPLSVVRRALAKADIFAFPSCWRETSCLSLMEAMAAECLCVHSDLGALPETAANWTLMYGYDDEPNHHAGRFYTALKSALETLKTHPQSYATKLKLQRSYVETFYNWDIRALQWKALLESMLKWPREIEKPSPAMFEYKVA
jgi:UDP-glucose:(glucosyl)LPS alpha-1,2-glucosyltransferase